MYRNSHTTSTKCQYHAAASNPVWWVVVKCVVVVRSVQIKRNVVPIITCRPWNPVATKNVVPYTLSLRANLVSIYSDAWR